MPAKVFTCTCWADVVSLKTMRRRSTKPRLCLYGCPFLTVRLLDGWSGFGIQCGLGWKQLSSAVSRERNTKSPYDCFYCDVNEISRTVRTAGEALLKPAVANACSSAAYAVSGAATQAGKPLLYCHDQQLNLAAWSARLCCRPIHQFNEFDPLQYSGLISDIFHIISTAVQSIFSYLF